MKNGVKGMCSRTRVEIMAVAFWAGAGGVGSVRRLYVSRWVLIPEGLLVGGRISSMRVRAMSSIPRETSKPMTEMSFSWVVVGVNLSRR